MDRRVSTGQATAAGQAAQVEGMSAPNLQPVNWEAMGKTVGFDVARAVGFKVYQKRGDVYVHITPRLESQY